jgi:hypothetical protein
MAAAAPVTSTHEIESLQADFFDLSETINKDAITTKRVFMTDKSNPTNHVYVKSSPMFVELVEANAVKSRCIDDPIKSFLDELDFHVLAEFNKKRHVFLPATAKPGNLRDFIKFTREHGSYIPLLITDKLNIVDADGKTKLAPHQLKHKMIRAIFSPLCVDIDKDNFFTTKYYGFTIQVMNEPPPTYILLELNEEGVEYVGGNEIGQDVQTTIPNLNFGNNVFS